MFNFKEKFMKVIKKEKPIVRRRKRKIADIVLSEKQTSPIQEIMEKLNDIEFNTLKIIKYLQGEDKK